MSIRLFPVRVPVAVRLLSVLLLLLMTAFCGVEAQSKPVHDTLDVVLLGDSNTWLGGDSCTDGRGWGKWFADVFAPATCRSYARSGATWTNTPRTVRNTAEYTELLGDDNVIYNQICRLSDAVASGTQPTPHIIIISAGTNDAWFSARRPDAFAMTVGKAFGAGYGSDSALIALSPGSVTTLAGSVRHGCALLRAAFPSAMIVLLTPLQTTATSLAAIRRTGDVLEACARRMGVGVVRQDGDSFVCRQREMKHRRMTTDGTHTSAEGARRNGTAIAAAVTRMYDDK